LLDPPFRSDYIGLALTKMVSPTTRTAAPAGGKASQPQSPVNDASAAPEKRGLTIMKTEGPPPPSTAVHVGLSQVDDTTVFYNLNKDRAGPLTPELERRIVRKNFWCLLCQTWWIAFLIHLDKSTLGQAATMGIFTDVDMSKAQFNSLFVVFYAGYLIALWPGAWLSQRVGQKWFITGSLLTWAFLLGMHPLVKTGRQLVALRFILGLVSVPGSPCLLPSPLWLGYTRSLSLQHTIVVRIPDRT
jgi:hypothetical protein